MSSMGEDSFCFIQFFDFEFVFEEFAFLLTELVLDLFLFILKILNLAIFFFNQLLSSFLLVSSCPLYLLILFLLFLFSALLSLDAVDVVLDCNNDIAFLLNLQSEHFFQLFDIGIIVIFGLIHTFFVDHLEPISLSLGIIVQVLNIMEVHFILVEQFLNGTFVLLL